MTPPPDKLKQIRDEFIKDCGLTLGTPSADVMAQAWDSCAAEYEKAVKGLVKALEFECGNRCAAQNPCNAKEALREFKDWSGK